MMFEEFNDVVTVNEMCMMLRIGRNAAYELLQTGEIKNIRVGKKYIIPKQSIVNFVNSKCYNSNNDITNVWLTGNERRLA